MKRLIALAIVLMLCIQPAFAEQDIFNYTDNVLEDGNLIYYFAELSLTLPADWQGKVMALQHENGVSFYQKASYEKYKAEGIDGGGFLFSLSASVNSDFTNLPSYEYLGFSEDSAMNYYLILPTDYPAYNEEAIRAEYDAMHADTDFVVSHASFYADAQEPAPAPAASEATPGQARYHFEHRMLPGYFYEVPDAMLDAIRDVGIEELWRSFCEENGIDPTYPAEDYAEYWYTADDGTVIAQVEMPQPDEDTLCYRVYFVYNA